MTKTDSPDQKKPRDPKGKVAAPPSATPQSPPENPPAPQPLNHPNPNKFTCLTCGKTFSTLEELFAYGDGASHSDALTKKRRILLL